MRTEISLPVLRTGPHFLDCPTRSLVTIPNKLSWTEGMKPEETLNLRILQYIVRNYTYLGTKTTKTNTFKSVACHCDKVLYIVNGTGFYGQPTGVTD
jgi:hypothetical protein